MWNLKYKTNEQMQVTAREERGLRETGEGQTSTYKINESQV